MQIIFKKDLFNPFNRPGQELTLWIRMDLGVMAMKGYSTLPKLPELKPYHQMQFSVISRTPLFFGGGEILSLCRGYSWYIESPVSRATESFF